MRQRIRNVQLVAAMAAQGVRQRDLATRAGITETTLSLIVNQRTDPKPTTAAAIAKALGTTPGKLFDQIGGAR